MNRQAVLGPALVALLLAALAAVASRGGIRLWGSAGRATGSALFHGQAPLTGRLAGHGVALPTLATRCSNCHEVNQGLAPGIRALPAASASPGSYARRLRSDWLTERQPRRGGPPSAYDADTLCTLLRTGNDPAHVVVPTVMPRYIASDSECRALWGYLVGSP